MLKYSSLIVYVSLITGDQNKYNLSACISFCFFVPDIKDEKTQYFTIEAVVFRN